MKHVTSLILAIFLILSNKSLINAQSAPKTTTNVNDQATNWLDDALSNILDNFNAGDGKVSGLMVNGSVAPRSASQAIYSVIDSDGTSTSTSYNTDPNGVVTTNTVVNHPKP